MGDGHEQKQTVEKYAENGLSYSQILGWSIRVTRGIVVVCLLLYHYMLDSLHFHNNTYMIRFYKNSFVNWFATFGQR